MVNRTNFGLQLASGRVPGIRVAVDSATGAMLSTPGFQRR
jgi:hypothetical protein